VTEQDSRTRTISWEDPLATLSQASGMSGLEYMRALFERKLPGPPIMATMGITGRKLEEGKVTFIGEPGEYLYNPIGSVHGGFAMTLLDSAMGCAVHTTLPAGVLYTTLETKVNFVRPITASIERVRCEGVVLHRGGKIATADGRLVDEKTGKLLAHGTSTCLILG
jgi:uncharacterized protein (TIGR00369 family)